MGWLTDTFGPYHCEPTRSEAALSYVWKDETSVEGTRFEFGTKPFDRSSSSQWESIWDLARTGRILEIDPQIRICHYRTIRSICADYAEPIGVVRTAIVLWGKTGVGKSRRAWEELGLDAYPKDPMSKFWCGYNGQKHVVVDEFRGDISINHILRWTDRYPCNVEIKGSSVPLVAEKYIFTSNLPPVEWYPTVDPNTVAALLRRLEVIEMVAEEE